jgi:AraC-like DNA-binding protein
MAMTTMQTSSAGTGDIMTAASVQAPDARSARGNVGSLPTCRLRRVTEYVQQNLDKDLTLANLAAIVNMSPYHFARLFKCSTGEPPHRFVVRQRITHARACLTAGLSIAQVAQMVGFRTPSHFTTAFRRVLGVTPGAYRAAPLRENRPNGKGGER